MKDEFVKRDIPFSPPDITEDEINEGGGYASFRVDNYRTEDERIRKTDGKTMRYIQGGLPEFEYGLR